MLPLAVAFVLAFHSGIDKRNSERNYFIFLLPVPCLSMPVSSEIVSQAEGRENMFV